MKSHLLSFRAPFALLCALIQLASLAHADEWSVAYLDELLAGVLPNQRTVQVGDMEILVTNLRAWRHELSGEPVAQSAFGGNVPLWTDGKIYYTFEATLSAAKRRAFLDGASEWAMFANLQFVPRVAQANYMHVVENASLAGGQSAVGMVGGQQLIQFGPTAWNRPTICHEIGHALGLVHEHQRSDRDAFVQVLTNNIAAGALGNFTKLGNSANVGAYDFLSVMHYTTNNFSVNPATLNTVYPLPAYAQFAPIIGSKYDPVLSSLDRAGMAAKYGAGPALTSVVTNTADSGPGSLRAALYHAFDHPGTTITFNIPTSDPGFSNGVFNVLPTDGFPSLVHATTLNGSSQPTNTNPSGPEILLNGTLLQPPTSYAHGLKLKGTNCTVRGFIVSGFPSSGILIEGPNSTGNTVAGCYLGVNSSGTTAATNGLYPIEISKGAKGNTIGGVNVADRNIISGSRYQGLVIRDAGTDFNAVLGNYIGLNAAGTAALPNTWSGVGIFGGARSNHLGGPTASAFNIISGNLRQGVTVTDSDTDGNRIDGNYIGLNAAGTAAIANTWSGLDIFGGASDTSVGGAAPGIRNVISGNGNYGVAISGAGTTGTIVSGNLIGLNAAGSAAIGNAWSGVVVYNGAQATLVGLPGFGNTISGNGNHGLSISGNGTTGNVVAGNTIGANVGGTAAVPNQWAGAVIYGGAQSNLIGGTTALERNVISGNGNQGVAIADANTRGNVVSGNYIGVNSTGSASLPNAWSGVSLYNGPEVNRIGGTVPGAGNVISGNGNQGVVLANAGTRNNLVQGNFIGLNAAGTAALPNTWSGVELAASSANVIGGGPGARNFISGNGNHGISINSDAACNMIQGNTIGLNGRNGAAIPNAYAGVIMIFGAVSNHIGGVTVGAANLIAGNASDGVQLSDLTTTNNSVRGNSIFGNSGAGIGLYNSANRSVVAPALSSAVLTTETTVTGSYNGAANTAYQIDFYADAPPTGSAEGRTYLGSRSVTTSGAGTANFTANLGALVPAGRAITASATDPAGNTSRLSTGVAVAVTSAVNDSIPNAWRALYFGGAGTTTNAQSCATCDADGDGANNRAELFAGTNPTNAVSVFKLAALPPAGSGDVASFPSSTGVVYRLTARDDAGSGAWSIIADQVNGTGASLTVNDPSSLLLPTRVYRAEVLW